LVQRIRSFNAIDAQAVAKNEKSVTLGCKEEMLDTVHVCAVGSGSLDERSDGGSGEQML
jgi:hypothetical protein